MYVVVLYLLYWRLAANLKYLQEACTVLQILLKVLPEHMSANTCDLIQTYRIIYQSTCDLTQAYRVLFKSTFDLTHAQRILFKSTCDLTQAHVLHEHIQCYISTLKLMQAHVCYHTTISSSYKSILSSCTNTHMVLHKHMWSYTRAYVKHAIYHKDTWDLTKAYVILHKHLWSQISTLMLLSMCFT